MGKKKEVPRRQGKFLGAMKSFFPQQENTGVKEFPPELSGSRKLEKPAREQVLNYRSRR